MDVAIARILARAGVASDLREAALRLAHARRVEREALYARIWRDLSPRDGDPALRRVARGLIGDLARTGVLEWTPDTRDATLLGLAAFRCGQPEEALRNLQHAVSTHGDPLSPLLPADLALLAMSRAQLGARDEAEAALSRLTSLLEGHPGFHSPRNLAFAAEARAQLAQPGR